MNHSKGRNFKEKKKNERRTSSFTVSKAVLEDYYNTEVPESQRPFVSLVKAVAVLHRGLEAATRFL